MEQPIGPIGSAHKLNPIGVSNDGEVIDARVFAGKQLNA